MYRSDSISNLAAALAAAQAEFLPAKMTSVNPFLKNKYADLGEVIQAARPALAKYGLAFTQHPVDGESVIAVETYLMHKSGEFIGSVISLPTGEEKGRSLAQGAGSLITYLRRYALAAILGIYADSDEDGNAAKPAVKPQPVKQEAPAPQPTNGDRPPELIEAENRTNRDGVRYGDIDTSTLTLMYNSMTKALKKDDLLPDYIEETNKKLEAARIIIEWRTTSHPQ